MQTTKINSDNCIFLNLHFWIFWIAFRISENCINLNFKMFFIFNMFYVVGYNDLFFNAWQALHQFSSVQSLSRVQLFVTPWIADTRPPCPSLIPGVHSDSHSSSQWCHPAISYSVIPFSSCPQSLPASESFPVSQLFTWGGQSTGVSALASFLPKKSHSSGSVVVEPLVALPHAASSWTGDQTGVPCTARQILNHRTIREAQNHFLVNL